MIDMSVARDVMEMFEWRARVLASSEFEPYRDEMYQAVPLSVSNQVLYHS